MDQDRGPDVRFPPPLLFVAVLALVVIAQLLYLAVAWAEYVALRWQR